MRNQLYISIFLESQCVIRNIHFEEGHGKLFLYIQFCTGVFFITQIKHRGYIRSRSLTYQYRTLNQIHLLYSICFDTNSFYTKMISTCFWNAYRNTHNYREIRIQMSQLRFPTPSSFNDEKEPSLLSFLCFFWLRKCRLGCKLYKYVYKWNESNSDRSAIFVR